jgi:hypothetical protein
MPAMNEINKGGTSNMAVLTPRELWANKMQIEISVLNPLLNRNHAKRNRAICDNFIALRNVLKPKYQIK